MKCFADVGFKQSLPRYVTAPAVFKCHRVSGIGSDEDEIAYLATVSINGHVFKGFVYDQGVVVDGKDEAMGCVSELQLGSNGGGKSNNRECSSAIHVPKTSAYPASACWGFFNVTCNLFHVILVMYGWRLDLSYDSCYVFEIWYGGVRVLCMWSFDSTVEITKISVWTLKCVLMAKERMERISHFALQIIIF